MACIFFSISFVGLKDVVIFLRLYKGCVNSISSCTSVRVDVLRGTVGVGETVTKRIKRYSYFVF